jgi:MinD-like ATPase involved in chromosome partitioning or flagellar assembly
MGLPGAADRETGMEESTRILPGPPAPPVGEGDLPRRIGYGDRPDGILPPVTTGGPRLGDQAGVTDADGAIRRWAAPDEVEDRTPAEPGPGRFSQPLPADRSPSVDGGGLPDRPPPHGVDGRPPPDPAYGEPFAGADALGPPTAGLRPSDGGAGALPTPDGPVKPTAEPISGGATDRSQYESRGPGAQAGPAASDAGGLVVSGGLEPPGRSGALTGRPGGSTAPGMHGGLGASEEPGIRRTLTAGTNDPPAGRGAPGAAGPGPGALSAPGAGGLSGRAGAPEGSGASAAPPGPGARAQSGTAGVPEGSGASAAPASPAARALSAWPGAPQGPGGGAPPAGSGALAGSEGRGALAAPGGPGRAAGGNAAGPPGQLPTVDQLTAQSLLGQRRPTPQTGWRRAVYNLTAHAVNPGQSPEDRRREELIARATVPVQGCYRIAVISLKGGVGKTTTTVTLGATLASLRGDRVIAVDANPDRGTLSGKIPLETVATVRNLLNDINTIHHYFDVRRYTSQSADRLEVLASESDPAVSTAFSEADYRTVAAVLERFYNIVLTDCGTGLLHSAMRGVLDLADQIVLVSSGSVDGARSASATLDWLEAHGRSELVRNSVAVINSVRPKSGGVDLDRLEEHFAARCRAVTRIPYDPHLEEGAEVDLGELSAASRASLLELAACVADAFHRAPRGPHRPRA